MCGHRREWMAGNVSNTEVKKADMRGHVPNTDIFYPGRRKRLPTFVNG